jgi:hypothetical protein
VAARAADETAQPIFVRMLKAEGPAFDPDGLPLPQGSGDFLSGPVDDAVQRRARYGHAVGSLAHVELLAVDESYALHLFEREDNLV